MGASFFADLSVFFLYIPHRWKLESSSHLLSWYQISHITLANPTYQVQGWYTATAPTVNVYSNLQVSVQRLLVYTSTGTDPYYSVWHPRSISFSDQDKKYLQHFCMCFEEKKLKPMVLLYFFFRRAPDTPAAQARKPCCPSSAQHRAKHPLADGVALALPIFSLITVGFILEKITPCFRR